MMEGHAFGFAWEWRPHYPCASVETRSISGLPSAACPTSPHRPRPAGCPERSGNAADLRHRRSPAGHARPRQRICVERHIAMG